MIRGENLSILFYIVEVIISIIEMIEVKDMIKVREMILVKGMM